MYVRTFLSLSLSLLLLPVSIKTHTTNNNRSLPFHQLLPLLLLSISIPDDVNELSYIISGKMTITPQATGSLTDPLNTLYCAPTIHYHCLPMTWLLLLFHSTLFSFYSLLGVPVTVQAGDFVTFPDGKNLHTYLISRRISIVSMPINPPSFPSYFVYTWNRICMLLVCWRGNR